MQKHLKITTPLLFAALLLLSIFSFSQPVVKKTVAIKADTAKGQPKLIPSYGAYTNGSKAFVADLKRLLTVNPQLKLKDDRGTIYQVVSFEIAWKKKDVSDDIRTGKQKTVYYFVGGDIMGNKLTANWREEIADNIKKGEEIRFETILYFDPKRKVNIKAPSLALTIL